MAPSSSENMFDVFKEENKGQCGWTEMSIACYCPVGRNSFTKC